MWKLCADTGGTFTDCLAVSPDGREARAKVLSSGQLLYRAEALSPTTWRLHGAGSLVPGFLRGASIEGAIVVAHQADEVRFDRDLPLANRLDFATGLEAPVVGAHVLTGTPLAEALPEIDFRLATTRGTNALLESRGARVALFVTEGFGDLLRIGDQTRPDLFALHCRRPEPIHDAVIEVSGRLNHEGKERSPLDLEAIRKLAVPLRARGIDTAAVALLHSYRNAVHEEQVADLLEELGFAYVVRSSETSPRIHYERRASTALIDAYLGPILEAYLSKVSTSLPEGSPLRVMTSAGDLVRREQFRAKDSLLSGPAGGVVGAAGAGKQTGADQILAFDMGGTSTDVSRYSGQYTYQSELQVGQARLQGNALRIETVAAGGGSLCTIVDGALRVGPESAGASPGPACYGAGGPLALTDIHVLLGRLDPAHFAIPLDIDASRRAFDQFLEEHQLSPEKTSSYLEGFLQIADERMADAVRRISLREGHDPCEHALVAFGGAGGLHACALADLLGIREIIVPGDAGILSARGLQRAALGSQRVKQVLASWSESADDVADWFRRLEVQAANDLDVARNLLEIERELALRFHGQENTLTVRYEPNADPIANFKTQYQSVFGHVPDREIELESICVRIKSRTPPRQQESYAKPLRNCCDAMPLSRSNLCSDTVYLGPRLISDAHSTLFLREGWHMQLGSLGNIRLTKADSTVKVSEERPPEVLLELFTQRFRHLVQMMGDQLKRTALSTNVKDRQDYSCCLLDSEGSLVANAPHIPVHLGAMGLCVRRVMEALPVGEGDIIVTNHPRFGGSHLPDLTVIMPVFHQGVRIAFVANRAHHAEIGGISPGSMPPAAKSLEEEGVILPPMHLFKGGRSCEAAVRQAFLDGPFPTRAIEENMADLQAQVASCRLGAHLLGELVVLHGSDRITDQLGKLYEQAAASARAMLSTQWRKRRDATEVLDDGSQICVRLGSRDDRYVIDFSGTSEHHPANLHATPAIVRSAVIYVMRLLQTRDLPLNEGLLDLLDIRLPPCFLNPDFSQSPAPPVVGGNVETSQRVVDTLLKALDLAACSQGTMNNLIFGNEVVSYYETIAGGAGAGPGFHGASGQHTHMTNTAITDPEILERRYPVILHQFRLRAESGGAGQFRGGDGVIREMEFTAPLTVSLLTQHRNEGPYGGRGGARGCPGIQIWTHQGREKILDALTSFEAAPGDRLRMETPGGGGWGKAFD